jgi:hypothetical protein
MSPDTDTPTPTPAHVVTATLNYLVAGPEKPKRYQYERPGLPEWTGVDDPHAMPIVDARGREDAFTLDRHGFAFLRHPSTERDFTDEAAITGGYYDECAAIVRGATGANRVVVFDHTLRGPNQPREPVMRVHNDYTETSAPQRVRDLVPDEAETRLKHRYAFINVWRPIDHAVLDTPLALCDATSFTEDDLIMTDLVYKDRLGEIASVRYNPQHRWVFFSNMTPDEVVLIKCHDTVRDGRARLSFHSAFNDPTAPANAKPRQSIEIRTIAFFES